MLADPFRFVLTTRMSRTGVRIVPCGGRGTLPRSVFVIAEQHRDANLDGFERFSAYHLSGRRALDNGVTVGGPTMHQEDLLLRVEHPVVRNFCGMQHSRF